MNVIAESALRVSIVILLSLTAAAVMRRRSAALRHWILASGVVVAMAMPALQVIAPRWDMPHQRISTAVTNAVPIVSEIVAPGLNATDSPQTPMGGRTSIAAIVAVVWTAGLVAAVVLLVAGVARLAWIAAHARPLVDERWGAPVREIASGLDLRREVTILQSTHERLLVTWGFCSPRIILPIGAEEWSDERIRVVLCHELSHVRRGDWVLQIVAGVVRAIYWFNPLIWIACRWLRHESERACDDDVLNLGMRGPDYATELLNIARTLRRPVWNPAPAMARPSSLQRRVRAMLNTTIDRRPVSGRSRSAIAATALSVSVVIAGSGAAAQIGSALSGSIVDALNNAIPNVTMTLRNTASGERYTVTSDADGRFTFDALPDGDYQGEINAPGFNTTHPFFRIKDGKSNQPTVIPLPLGSIEESVTVTSNTPPPSVASPPARARAGVDALRSRVARRDPNAAIWPPLKTQDVRPLYPQNRTDEEATVFLNGIIDTNGLMKGLQVLQPVNEDFARAAFDAVNAWRFEPTRLHGVPVDTSIHVTVRFVH
jgi:TonB family protein